jgi:nucleotide-binding universal stress UspA family protein
VKPPVIRRVLVGYNGSPLAQRALVFAERLAGLLHAQLRTVAVAQPLALGSEVEGRVVGHRARVLLGHATMSAIARQIIALAPCAVTAVPDFDVTPSSCRRRFIAEGLATALARSMTLKGIL